ncbi:MAG: NUDIX hydrolase [Trueperaceae bacterium]|nr:NUDIX hydrolase [Trueperaceae bacterium]
MLIDESWYQKPEGIKKRTSSGGVIIRREDERVLLALARHKGYTGYVLPKGGVDKGESLLEAAQREIEEEAGFSDLELLADLGVLERLSFSKTRWIKTHYYLFLTRQINPQPTETERHVEPHWFDLETLPTMFWPEQQSLIEAKKEFILETLEAFDQAQSTGQR